MVQAMKTRTAVGPAWLALSLLVPASDGAAQDIVAQSARDRFDCSLMRGLQCRA